MMLQSGATFAAVCSAGPTFSPNGNFSASFSVCDNSSLNVTLTANTAGWLAIGFSANAAMANSDMVIGGVNADGSVYASDRFSAGYAPPSVDASQDVTNVSGSEANGATTFSFSRQLNTGDSAGDFNLLSGAHYLIWAYGVGDTFGYHGGVQRGGSAEKFNFASSPVPLPAAAWLFLSGLMGCLWMKPRAFRDKA